MGNCVQSDNYDAVINIDIANIFANNYLSPEQKLYYYLLHHRQHTEEKINKFKCFLESINNFANYVDNERLISKTREKVYVLKNNTKLTFNRKQLTNKNWMKKIKEDRKYAVSLIDCAITNIIETNLHPDYLKALIDKKPDYKITFKNLYDHILRGYNIKYEHTYEYKLTVVDYEKHRGKSRKCGEHIETRHHTTNETPMSLSELKKSFITNSKTKEEQLNINATIKYLLTRIDPAETQNYLKLITLCEITKHHDVVKLLKNMQINDNDNDIQIKRPIPIMDIILSDGE